MKIYCVAIFYDNGEAENRYKWWDIYKCFTSREKAVEEARNIPYTELLWHRGGIDERRMTLRPIVQKINEFGDSYCIATYGHDIAFKEGDRYEAGLFEEWEVWIREFEIFNEEETVGEATQKIATAKDVVHCWECKHNPKETWFECPMAHLSESQRPETAWCWKGERKVGNGG